MTLQAFPHPVMMAPFVGAAGGNIYTSTNGINVEATIQLNAAGDGVGVVFQALETTMIDQITFWVAVATTAGTAGDIEVSIQTLDSSGLPSGTPVTSSNTATQTISTTGRKAVSGIAGSATLTVGTQYALCIVAGAGWDRDLTIRYAWGTSGASISMPYAVSKTAASWTKLSGTTFGWFFGAEDSSGNPLVIPGLVGAATIAAPTFNDASNPDERGNRFVLDAPKTCIGVAYYNSAGSAPGNTDAFAVSLYSGLTGTPTQLATAAIDGDAQTTNVIHYGYFPAPVDLAAGTTYALAFKPTSTDTQSVARYEYDSASDREVLMGPDFYMTSRDGGSGAPAASGNAFTDDDTKVYCVWPIFSKSDDATGGGGGGMLVHPGMVGGMRG